MGDLFSFVDLAADGKAPACTAPRCGFSADYDSRAAAELAARTHRCPVR
ncbi:mobile element transfer protein [Streptomyces sp. NPDC058961]